ncbi:MAG TPA: FeoB-associated Cys-rich membrane protein [Pyrinomonadaceae bacterium]|nr:FeoB-associated Cys-rich membrane protein [Pyrinomonadaceae bacterium]
MFSDWQTIAVWVIILGALAYVGRRGWERVRSFQAGGKSESACASGCGSCGDERPAATKTRPQNVLVQLTSSAGSATGRQRKP